jgi:ubiquinone/menaquinone biosynthesis C-methylase UbiE
MDVQEEMMQTSSKEWGNVSESLAFILEQQLRPDSVILDIGCNTGTLVFHLTESGFQNVHGIDVDQKAVERGRRLYPELGSRIAGYSGAALSFPPESVDVITMFDVLEHIPEVEKFLSGEVWRVLKKGGTLLFQTPNKYTNIPWEILIHRSFSKYKSYHVSLQSYWSLGEMLDAVGFDETTISKRSIRNSYYLEQLQQQLGPLASPVVRLFNALPTPLSTNFWGSCLKPRSGGR